MRKGYILEKEIDKVLRAVGRLGYHAHKNHPQRTVDGTYIEGEPFDYEVFLPDGIDVFDAKEVSGKWHMKEKDLRQCNNLMQCAKAGCRAYFLILFDKIDGAMELIDDTTVDLSGYVTTESLATTLAGYVQKDGDKVLSDNNYDDTAKAAVDGLPTALAGKMDIDGNIDGGTF